MSLNSAPVPTENEVSAVEIRQDRPSTRSSERNQTLQNPISAQKGEITEAKEPQIPEVFTEARISSSLPALPIEPPINSTLLAEIEKGVTSKEEDDDDAEVPREKWNSSKLTLFRVITTFGIFLLVGVNDAVIGALLPYLQEDYGVTYIVVSVLFLSPAVGYSLSAFLNPIIHYHLGQRGIALIAGGCHIVAYVIACVRPPFGVLVVALLLAGFGSGLHDSAWNAWIGGLANSHELLGFLHGFYGLGGAFGPLVSTFMIAETSLKWNNFYYILVGTASLETVVGAAAFWKSDGPAYRKRIGHTVSVLPEDEEKAPAAVESGTNSVIALENEKEVEVGEVKAKPKKKAIKSDSSVKQCLLQAPQARIVWLLALYLFLYVGAEISLSGWIVTFQLEVRKASKIASGMTSVGYWLGMTAGRMILGFITSRIGARTAILTYLALSITLEFIFWFVPNMLVSAISVSLLGFFIGPLFPAAVAAATTMLPTKLHVTALGIAASAGGIGGTIFPFMVGAITQVKGVRVLQPFVLALLLSVLATWLCLPRTTPGWRGWVS